MRFCDSFWYDVNQKIHKQWLIRLKHITCYSLHYNNSTKSLCYPKVLIHWVLWYSINPHILSLEPKGQYIKQLLDIPLDKPPRTKIWDVIIKRDRLNFPCAVSWLVHIINFVSFVSPPMKNRTQLVVGPFQMQTWTLLIYWIWMAPFMCVYIYFHPSTDTRWVLIFSDSSETITFIA